MGSGTPIVLTTRACDAGTKGGSQLSYCETVLNSAFFVTVPFLRIKDVWCRQYDGFF